MGKYLVVGCDNGCIEIYDTDTLECLYGFGLVKFGPIKNLECNSTYQYIYGLDAEGDVYMAHFGNKNDYWNTLYIFIKYVLMCTQLHNLQQSQYP